MAEPPPVGKEAAWLYAAVPATHPRGLTQAELMRACRAAAVELGVRRQRSAIERERLTTNLRALLEEIAERDRERHSPGSLHWDLTHCRLSLEDAAENALAAEYAYARYRVMQSALRAVFAPDDPSLRPGHLRVPVGDREVPIMQLAHEGEEGLAQAIRFVSSLIVAAAVHPMPGTTSEPDQSEAPR